MNQNKLCSEIRNKNSSNFKIEYFAYISKFPKILMKSFVYIFIMICLQFKSMIWWNTLFTFFINNKIVQVLEWWKPWNSLNVLETKQTLRNRDTCGQKFLRMLQIENTVNDCCSPNLFFRWFGTKNWLWKNPILTPLGYKEAYTN